ncbi:peptidoglycan-binding protein [Streptomyces griseus]|uniref:peptidoglycan-binding protein n=1 Tax=Streptomyces griseus TaxID=1911 RepID=UPI00055F03DD|nr:peptidoglycan-binding protein [Streptomyces griseus]
METPVFEEFDPVSDCDCPGCALRHRALPPSSPVGRAAVHRTLIVAAAASTALGAGHAVPALAAPHGPVRPGVPADDDPETPQGGAAPLHGAAGTQTQPTDSAKPPPTTRTEIIDRARRWVRAKVPYRMSAYWSDGYRQDCSGFVSMAWNLPGNEWTGSLHRFGDRISKEELQPGDMLLFHNPANPQNGSHVVLFGGWTNGTHTTYAAYEQTRPHTRTLATPYAYWSNANRYVPYRYKYLTTETAARESAASAPKPAGGTPHVLYPGPAAFGPGADNAYVAQLGRMLVARGAGSSYGRRPGSRWSDADRRATRAFQLAQGWRGADADGLPGPRTWALLVTGKGRAATTGAAGPTEPSGTVPAYPGRAVFRPGAENAHVTQLGRQLVRKGFGRHYPTDPGPRWGEADRRAVEAFQRAQGWRGGAADGYPGPETWRRLFS